MKRVILAITGTIAGVVALLSFKTQTGPVAGAGTLPSAGLSTTSSAGAAPSTGVSSGAATSSSTTSASSSSAATSSHAIAAAAAKSYLGSAITTRYGVVQVKVTVKGQKITNVVFTQLTSFDGRSQQINSYAGPQLLRETLSAQNANVDTISGASYTSDGYRQSLQSALDKAGK